MDASRERFRGTWLENYGQTQTKNLNRDKKSQMDASYERFRGARLENYGQTQTKKLIK